MKLVFIYGKPISSALTKFFTGSTCYHVGFTDGVKFWDMNKIRRRRLWPNLYPAERVLLAELPPECTLDAAYLDYKLDTDDQHYGNWDYLAFGLRWFYHLVGKSTVNYGGIICSEMCVDDMINTGWRLPAHVDFYRRAEVPSPADLELIFLGFLDAIKNR
jgi:hypothetical protein